MGWDDALSASAAYSSSRAFSMRLWWMPLTSNTPCVSVPVLSNRTMRVFDSVSRKFEPLTSTPALLAPPMPAKNESGMLITSAQGQEMTRNVSAR